MKLFLGTYCVYIVQKEGLKGSQTCEREKAINQCIVKCNDRRANKSFIHGAWHCLASLSVLYTHCLALHKFELVHAFIMNCQMFFINSFYHLPHAWETCFSNESKLCALSKAAGHEHVIKIMCMCVHPY